MAMGARRKSRNPIIGLVGKACWGLWLTLDLAAHRQARGDRAGLVFRFWAWQVWRRVARRPIVVRLPNGVCLICPPWSDIASAWVAIGFHEYTEMLFVMDLLRPGDGVIDVGANLGIYSVSAAALGARVLAFEPNPGARATLEANLVLNGVDDRVRVEPHALADFDGEAAFTTTLAGSNHLVLASEETPTTSRVTVRRLDGVVAAKSLPATMALLKVDAEGFDPQVLAGAVATISEQRPVIIVEQLGTAPALRQVLAELGYEPFEYLAESRALISVPPTRTGHQNLICVHPSRRDWLEERLSSAARQPALRPKIFWRVPA